jgi:two-component system alkaline phosphatase synthesis response regulator PhoP
MKKILIIEDEKNMVEGLRYNLEARDYFVIDALDGETGLKKASGEQPDLIILDLMLPGLNGYEVCKRLKETIPEIPIIMLTAKSQESDIVTGLDLGADDYITKPFSVLELLARINALLRRSDSNSSIPEVFHLGDLEINFKTYEAHKKGKSLHLSPREFEILRYLLERQGEVVSRDDLLNKVWGYESFPYTRTIDAHIGTLRKKIEENPDKPVLIITIHGKGYKFL